jgi:hypothetical protein
MKIKIVYTLIFCLCFVPAFAQKNKKEKLVKVEAKIQVLMEGSYSKQQIQEKAIQAARIKAMGDVFGYAIIQGINTQIKTSSANGVMTSTSINEVSNTMVKGEWVTDDKGFPRTKFYIKDQGDEQEIWLECEVKGAARKIEEAEVDFESFAFNCQEPHKCNSGQFKHNDSMFLYFKSPTSGYMSVFLQEEGLVYRLLPYKQMQEDYESTVPIEADKEYLLFSPEHRDYFKGFADVDEYGLETRPDGEPLSNFVYVAFSKKPFNKPKLSLHEDSGIKVIDLEEFQGWVNKNKGLDKDFQVKRFSITVNK